MNAVGSQEVGSYAAAVVLASGAGTRVGADRNKVLLPLSGRPVVAWSLDAFAATPGVGVTVLVVREQDRAFVESMLPTGGRSAGVELVIGGVTRHDSELNALRWLASRITSGEIDTVLLHDAARPLVSPALAESVLAAAREHGAAIPGVAEDLITVDADGGYAGVPGGELIGVQTPQACRAGPLLRAYEHAAREGYGGTDTASCIERYAGLSVHWVPGESSNFKITYPHDLAAAESVLRARDHAARDHGVRRAPRHPAG